MTNYIMIFLLGTYVLAAYALMWTRRPEAGLPRGEDKTEYVLLNSLPACRYLIHGIGHAVLLFETRDIRILPLYLLELAFFIIAGIVQRKVFPNSIVMLYQHMQLLLSAGFIVLLRLDYGNAVKQFVMAAAAFSICLFLPFVLKTLPKLETLGWLYTSVGLFLLGIVLLLGSEVFGAKNWLTIRNFTFQPSEFVKLTFILSMAALLVRETKGKYKNLLVVSFVAALHVGMLALSNDFGGALIFFSVYLLMLFVVSADVLFPTAALLAGSGAALLAYRYSGHIRERVMAWQDPFSCIEDEGYQIAQSYFAIGSGGWFGTGLTKGMPKTVPVVKSDFIFAAISEELGAVFAALLLAVYIHCILQMLTLALERKQPFFFAVTTGAAALFGVQAFLNVGGVIKLIPSTGVTLGFISYGGSSLFGTMFLFQGIQAMRGIELEKPTKKKKEKQKRSGQQIRMVTVCSLLLLLLSVTLAYFVGITVREAEKHYFNDYNRRIKALEETMLKGKILAGDGTVLAHSMQGADGTIYRLYPHGEKTAFITGQMEMGRTGLEDSWRETLYEEDYNVFQKIMKQAKNEPLEGNRIVTTIDMELQNAAWEALSGYQGTIGVMELSSGKILAMASSPGYDPNEISSVWESLNQSENAPLLNRFTGGLYPPGSTFKLVTTLAYLKEHVPSEFQYVCTGTARVNNTTVHCYKEKAHGTQTLEEAFANSCNTAYAVMGEQISVETYRKTAEELGFEVQLDGTLKYKKSAFPLTEASSAATRVQTSFGQGETLMTPFHNLLLAASIAGKGTVKLPYLVEKVETQDGELKTWYGTYGEIAFMTEENSAVLDSLMKAASVEKFAGLSEKGIKVAGKTGSAEYSKEKPAHAWYIGYAPADDPQIAFCVLLESCGTGSVHAVPAAEKLLQAYFGFRE